MSPGTGLRRAPDRSWSLFVPGEPRAMQTGRVVKLPDGRRFPTRRRSEWGTRIALAADAQRPPALLQGPLRAGIFFYRARPRSAPKRVRWPITRPDLDNCLKGLLDNLVGIVYHDDAQIVELVAGKGFADDRGPGVAIEVERIAAEP